MQSPIEIEELVFFHSSTGNLVIQDQIHDFEHIISSEDIGTLVKFLNGIVTPNEALKQ